MAYKNHVEEQRKFSYDEFLKYVKYIEKYFTEEVSKKISGRYIYVLLDGCYDCTYFVKTTVSDLRSIDGKIDFECLFTSYNGDDEAGIAYYSLKEPNRKSFKGKIKFIPKGTVSLTFRCITKKQNGKADVFGFDNEPILQNEEFLISRCDEAFQNNEEGVDYNYIENNAFSFLSYDKRISCFKKFNANVNKDVREMHSAKVQEIVSKMYDVGKSWGVYMVHNGNSFIFPLKREYIQELFKKRDKEDGRRKTIASLVSSYTRKDGTEVDGHLRTANSFSIDGRRYGMYIGMEDFEKMIPNTNKSKKRLKKAMQEYEVIGGIAVQKVADI